MVEALIERMLEDFMRLCKYKLDESKAYTTIDMEQLYKENRERLLDLVYELYQGEGANWEEVNAIHPRLVL